MADRVGHIENEIRRSYREVELAVRQATMLVGRDGLVVDDAGTTAGFVGAIEDVDDLHRAEQEARERQEELARRARHDSLTGLANRSVLDDRLAAARLGASGPVLAFFVDVDHFKHVNDEHGHTIGDEVLVEVARRLGQVVRDDDLLVRMGGDEFVGWCAAPRQQHDVKRMAERLVSAISETPIRARARELAVTVSVGVAIAPAAEADRVLARADRALYEAKRSGRDG